MPKVDIAYARAPIVFSSIIGFIYSRLLRCFYIYEAPDVWPDELVVIKSPLLPFVMSFGKIIAKLSYFSADLIITVSESAAEYINSHYNPRTMVVGIPSGVDIENFSPASKAMARDKLIKEKILPAILYNKFIVLYSGRISAAQKIDDLVYAAKSLLENGDIYIIIIGEGAANNRLHNYAVQNNLDNVIFLPFQKREMMPLIISSVDVCTLFLAPEPVYRIAIPTKFYEYLSCQKPIIGVCQGEVEKIIKKYNIGLTCPSGNVKELTYSILKMRKLINSTDILENCKNALQNFSLEAISYEFKTVLENNLVNRKPYPK
jgi:glycosyltransferase involved in cell wall biosynthesis